MSTMKIAILGVSALAMSACATNQGENATDAQGSTDTMSAPAGNTTTGAETGTTNQMDAMTPTPGTTTNTTTSDPGMMGTTNTGTANEANSTSPPQ